MDSKAPHADSQDRRLKRIAREKGFTCPDCGVELSSRDSLETHRHDAHAA